MVLLDGKLPCCVEADPSVSSVWALGIGVLETEKGNVCGWITWYRILERPSCVKVPDDSSFNVSSASLEKSKTAAHGE